MVNDELDSEFIIKNDIFKQIYKDEKENPLKMFNPLDIELDEQFCKNNRNFRMIKFFLKHAEFK